MILVVLTAHRHSIHTNTFSISMYTCKYIARTSHQEYFSRTSRFRNLLLLSIYEIRRIFSVLCVYQFAKLHNFIHIYFFFLRACIHAFRYVLCEWWWRFSSAEHFAIWKSIDIMVWMHKQQNYWSDDIEFWGSGWEQNLIDYMSLDYGRVSLKIDDCWSIFLRRFNWSFPLNSAPKPSLLFIRLSDK